jgi:hypothetical protein
MGKVQACFIAMFWLEVAHEHGNRAEGRKFDVAEINVR